MCVPLLAHFGSPYHRLGVREHLYRARSNISQKCHQFYDMLIHPLKPNSDNDMNNDYPLLNIHTYVYIRYILIHIHNILPYSLIIITMTMILDDSCLEALFSTAPSSCEMSALQDGGERNEIRSGT